MVATWSRGTRAMPRVFNHHHRVPSARWNGADRRLVVTQNLVGLEAEAASDSTHSPLGNSRDLDPVGL